MPEKPLSDLAVHSARPTVRIEGAEQPRVSELTIGMSMSEREGGLSALELRLSNLASDAQGGAAAAFEDETVLALGKSIEVYAGDQGRPQEIFAGAITALEAAFPKEGPPELVVLAEDRLQQARMARRTAVHDEITLADLAAAVANELGLTPQVTGFTETVGTWVQINESDLAFLRRVLNRFDGDVQVVGDELHVSPRGDVRRGALDLELHSQLRTARVVADLAQQVTEISVGGWDALLGERLTATSQGSRPGPGEGRSGRQILGDTLGPRVEHVGQPTPTTGAEAQALADAIFDRAARRFVCLEATAEGNPALRVGTHVTVSGLSNRFDNTYYVSSACHRWDVERGYETDFEAECASLGEA